MKFSPPIAVLKFGSSVLDDISQVPLAVEEIYRQRRLGFQVVAVVSAIGGVTNDLIEESKSVALEPDGSSLALLLATGETRSVGLLTMACLDSGIAALAVVGYDLGLQTTSDFLDAEPRRIDGDRIRSLFLDHDVLIIPGFIGQDEGRRTTLLGRGGSDLTAIFVAAKIGAASCTLLKDTDGVFESDPAEPGPSPKQYAHLSFADALELEGEVLQKKALQWASDLGQTFDVRRLGGDVGTQIGSERSRLCTNPELNPPLKVSLLGCGQVGRAVLRRLLRTPERFAVQGVAVKDVKKKRVGVPQDILVADAIHLVSQPADLVIELMGEVSLAKRAIKKALRGGSHVVTANKELMAQYGDELLELARLFRRSLYFAASVGGAVPVIEIASKREGDRKIVRFVGVFNGTSNFVLDQLHKGASKAEAVRLAQEAGYCEANPDDDLSGHDAARKLVVLSREIWGRRPMIQVVGQIDGNTESQCVLAASEGKRLCQVASVSLGGSQPVARVRLEELPSDSFLGQAVRAENRICIHYETGEIEELRGLGAGPNPTAEAVLGDVLEILRDHAQRPCEALDQEVGS